MLWTTERKIIFGFGGALVVLIMVAAVAVWLTLALLGELAAVSLHNNVLQGIREFRNSTSQMSSAARLYAAEPTAKNFAEWDRAQQETRERLAEVTRRVGSGTTERERLRQIETIMEDKIRRTREGASSAELQQLWDAESFSVLRELLVKLDRDEQNFLRERNAEATQEALLALVTIGLASILAMVVVGGATGMILRDLSARRRAEEELERARLAAEAASVAKSSFLANMSHELRTPLTSILGYADLLLGAVEPPSLGGAGIARREDYVRTMRRSGEHLLTLINDILDVSKIEAGRMNVESVACRLVDILADVQSMMRSRAAEKNIAFTIEYASPIPERVMTDPTRLRQILMNLVGNAVKFTSAGSVRVLVRFAPPPMAGHAAPQGDRANDDTGAAAVNGAPQAGRLDVEVIDTGVGIGPEEQALLFQPFAQADLSTTRRFGGTGLGLSISRRLAEMLDGELTVQSKLGEGSTFRLSLIVGVSGNRYLQPAEAQQAATVITREYAPRQLGLRILLAEDGEESREVITLHLRHAGCQVTPAADGEQAHRIATDAAAGGAPFDVILMDMQMPVMDGYTATSKLRAEGYQGVIVALTAHALTEDRERCLRVGCDEYAAKPVDMPALLALMERLCGRSTAPQVNQRLLQDPVLRKLRQKFCEGTADKVAELRAQESQGKLQEVAAGAHRLAGAAGAFGFESITREAKALETHATPPPPADRDQLREQLDRLEEACRHARGELEQVQNA
jgi:signal transduction histidine kinase/DNA-binding response OmpR family regulator